jgi:ribonuclease HI
MPYYAVANGRNIGIFSSWSECFSSVHEFPNARFKKFTVEQDARGFLTSSGAQGTKRPLGINDTISIHYVSKKYIAMLNRVLLESKQEILIMSR